MNSPPAPTVSPQVSDAALVASNEGARGDGPAAGPSLSAEAAEVRPLLRAVIAKMLGAHPRDADVEDCTHEALRRALEGKDRLREGEPFRPWVVGIATHVALDALRARKRQRERLGPSPREDNDDGGNGRGGALDRVADDAPSAFDRLADAERSLAVRAAMAGLPDGAREALTLFHIEGLAYAQISERLGVPLGTVATWVTRGRKALQAALMHQEKQQENRS